MPGDIDVPGDDKLSVDADSLESDKDGVDEVAEATALEELEAGSPATVLGATEKLDEGTDRLDVAKVLAGVEVLVAMTVLIVAVLSVDDALAALDVCSRDVKTMVEVVVGVGEIRMEVLEEGSPDVRGAEVKGWTGETEVMLVDMLLVLDEREVG